MNAVMQDSRAEVRFMGLATLDQIMIIVAASPQVMQKAVDAGLLQLGDAKEAEGVGKAFEEQVIRSLLK